MYKRIGLVVVGTAIALSLTACGTDMNRATRELDRNTDGMRTQSTDRGNSITGQNAARNDGMLNNGGNTARNDNMLNNRDGNDQHEMLLQQVRNVSGVNDATLFVNGNDIVVGLDLDDSSKGAAVEKSVKQALQKSNTGYNVHVTSDVGMHDRIRQIKGQMVPMDGHPIRNMANDITTLLEDMGRMVTEPLR